MFFGFLNLVMLAGLAAIAIPPIIHLWNRRRYVVVDWGAMQFLQMSQTTQRRILWEDLLLMLLRMGLIALLVLSLAGPYVGGSLLAGFAGGASRDVVLILDASASMSRDGESGTSLFETARTWTSGFLARLRPGDRVAILQTQQQVLPVVSELTSDLSFAVGQLAKLQSPAGACRWPRAVEEALKIVQDSRSLQRQIILVGDGQRFGWADPEALSTWENLSPSFSTPDAPKLFAVILKPADKRTNYSLAPLKAGRAAPWAGQSVQFKTALRLDGFKEYQAPARLRMEVNGRHVRDLKLPDAATTAQGQVPISFEHKFAEAGVHLLSVIIEDRTRDAVPADNRADLAVEALESLPVLIVDGGDTGKADSSSFFVQKALSFSPAGSRSGVLANVVPLVQFDGDPSIIDTSKPRVIILLDVPTFSEKAERALSKFLAEGGGVFLCLGERVLRHRDYYNDKLFAQNKGWLPARLEQVDAGNASIDIQRLLHPALDVFRDQAAGTLGQIKFARWWKVSTGNPDDLIGASFSNGLPWLIEKEIGKGKVLLSTTPLDRSWGSDLPTRWEFPVLMHELVYHLAKARSAEFNIEPGQPIRLAPDAGPEAIIHTPDGEQRKITADKLPIQFGPHQVGVYRVETQKRPAVYYVAQPDVRESDLTSCTKADRDGVAGLLPVQHVEPSAPIITPHEDDAKVEVWWLFVVGVVVLLCGELWLTRRMALSRGGV